MSYRMQTIISIVIYTYSHFKALVVVRVIHVSNIKKPDISDIQNLIVMFIKELLKILSWLEQLTKPNHGWQVGLPTFQVGASKLNIA